MEEYCTQQYKATEDAKFTYSPLGKAFKNKGTSLKSRGKNELQSCSLEGFPNTNLLTTNKIN